MTTRVLVEAVPEPSAADLARSERSDGRIVVQAWLASRGLIFGVLLLLAVHEGRSVSEMVSNWDVRHFENLAINGYLGEADGTLMAFFPGLPTLLALGMSAGLSVQVTGVLLSLAGSAVAAAALLRLGGPWAAVAWLFAPTAVFTVVPYTESLFCAAAFWAWERARAHSWWAMALLAGAACTLRVSGLFLVGALFILVVTLPRSRVPWRTRLTGVAWLAVPLGVIAAFAGYLYLLTGSWTAWYSAQKTGWVRELTWPWESFLNTIPAIVPGAYADHPWWAAVFRGEMVSMFVGVAVVIWCLAVSIRARSRPEPVEGRDGQTLWGEASWVGVQVLAFSISYWFFSVNRALLLWFPLWMMIGRFVEWRPRAGHTRTAHRGFLAVALTAETVFMLWWCWLFFTGHWAS